MRDAIGGTVALVIIAVFIVIALGYMAFNVNYTKAFRMKNKIIAVYEDYDGQCTGKCNEIIEEYANTLGYSTGNDLRCEAGYNKYKELYCYKIENVNNNEGGQNAVEDSKKYYYKIVTKINIEIPIINNLLNLQIFSITGDTRSFKE